MSGVKSTAEYLVKCLREREAEISLVPENKEVIEDIEERKRKLITEVMEEDSNKGKGKSVILGDGDGKELDGVGGAA